MPADGGGGDELPPDPGDHGGPRRGGPPRPVEPFVQSRWGVWVAAGTLLLFGGQSLAVVWLSRSGLGTEVVAWALGAVSLATFTGVLIVGARYIARHRYGS